MNRVLLASILASSACASHPTTPAEPVSVEAPASPPVAEAPLSPPAVEENSPPEPALAPIAPEQPPQLRSFAWGECRRAGVTVVDDEVFVHHHTYQGSKYGQNSVIWRVGPEGEVVEDLRYDVAPQVRDGGHVFEPPPQRLRQLGGRWPEGLFAVVDYSYREYEGVRLATWTQGKWTLVKLFGNSADWAAVWPWHDGSTLALLRQYKRDRPRTRLAVVRGAGKGPSLDALRGKPGCADKTLDFVDIHVSPDGPVTAIAACSSTWLVRWTPTDLQGTVVLLDEEAIGGGALELDNDGNGAIGTYGGDSPGLHAWRDGSVAPMRSPVGGVSDLATDANGALWLRGGGTIYRQSGDGWEQEIDGVSMLAGVEASSPIVELTVGDLRARTADGTWHPVELTQLDPKGTRPEVIDIVVPKAGDIWVAAEYRRYWKGKKVLRKFGAIHTQRPVAQAHECR